MMNHHIQACLWSVPFVCLREITFNTSQECGLGPLFCLSEESYILITN